jgi:radical SAM superfamily enzyme YgiQ (UPF0313 family)
MSRVFFVSVNLCREPFPVYPLGMGVVAQALEASGHEVCQFDLLQRGGAKAELCAELRAYAPDVVCLSLRNLDDAEARNSVERSSTAAARQVVGIVRECSAAPIVLGGPAFSLLPESWMAALGADFGVVGEGEEAICELVATLERGGQPARLWRQAGVGLGAQAMLGASLRPELCAFYLAESGMLGVQSKRGCPFRCAYCAYPALEGRIFRHRPVAAVIEDIRALRGQGASRIFITDSVFNDPAGRYLQLAEAMLSAGLGVEWTAFFRPAAIADSEMALLKRSGLCAVELGTDGATDITLAAQRKDFEFAAAVDWTQACIRHDIPCVHYLIFGGPGETPDTLTAGLRNLERLSGSAILASTGVQILPGTRVHELALAEGQITASTPLETAPLYFSPHLDRVAMEQQITTAFRAHREWLYPPDAAREAMAVMYRFGYRGTLWETLLATGGRYRRAAVRGSAR